MDTLCICRIYLSYYALTRHGRMLRELATLSILSLYVLGWL